jgi:hypothetical protein
MHGYVMTLKVIGVLIVRVTYMCVCVCVCVCTHTRTLTHSHTHTYTYILYMIRTWLPGKTKGRFIWLWICMLIP